MKLTILGSGTFFVSKEVSASAFLLDTGNKKILIDCGPGTLVKLSQAGIDIKDLDYVFLTHFHPDHSSDIFPLFMNYRLSGILGTGEISEFPIFFGPEGISKFFLDYSHISQLHSFEGWDKIQIEEYKPVINLGDILVKTFKVEHQAFNFDTLSYALRFEIDGKVITFSGDSAICPGISEACKDADLFVCDASFPSDQPTNKAHMNTTEIGELAQRGNVKKIILDHFYPKFYAYDLISEVKKNYNGEVTKAKDLDTVEI